MVRFWNQVFYPVIAIAVFIQQRSTAHEMILDSISEPDNDFAFDLLRKLSSELDGKNLIFSPIGIVVSLGILLEGAEGNTRRQILRTLGLEMHDYHNTRAALNNIVDILQNHASNTVSDIESTIFASSKLQGLKSQFGQNVFEYYNATIKSSNFDFPEIVARRINGFVSKHTRGQINQVISPDEIDPFTRLILLNVLLFKGTWNQTFPQALTANYPFRTPNSRQPIRVAMMSNTGEYGYKYFSQLWLSAVELQYSGTDITFLALLPKAPATAGDIIEQLDDSVLRTILTGVRANVGKLKVSIPKFSLRSKIDFITVLKELGITDLFSSRSANLSGITSSEVLFVKILKQLAAIDVDEKGTKASAVTEAAIQARSLTLSFVADQPFIYLILLNDPLTILFAGIVNDPTQN